MRVASSSRVTLSVSFIFGCIPEQISVRFRETCFQFREQARVCRVRAFSLSIYESVTSQRVAMQRNGNATFRAAYRFANGFAHSAYLRANDYPIQTQLRYCSYFKIDAFTRRVVITYVTQCE